MRVLRSEHAYRKRNLLTTFALPAGKSFRTEAFVSTQFVTADAAAVTRRVVALVDSYRERECTQTKLIDFNLEHDRRWTYGKQFGLSHDG